MKNNITEERKLEAAAKQAKERRDFLEAFNKNPFIGYDSLDEALADYKCSTQAEALARLLNRENVFISGPAGSGKTEIIKTFINLIKAEYSDNFDIALTASTGVAATLINGVTLHSWAGLGISNKPFDKSEIDPQMLRKAASMKYADVLIIDEISMLPAYIFDKLDQAMRHFRRSSDPFGGIQLVLIGDFLQLPPVDRNEPGVNAGFAPTSEVWKELDLSYCYMDKVHRATDPELQHALSMISRDMVDEDVRATFNSRMGKKKDPNKVYTTLFTTNQNVDKFNEAELAKNPNSLRILKATTTGDKVKAQKIFKNQGVPEEIHMKEGATIILTSNTTIFGDFFANGSIGKVSKITAAGLIIQFNDGRILNLAKKVYAHTEKSTTPYTNPFTGKDEYFDIEVAAVEQYPVRLGYAITVHKSQGQSFDAVEVDLSKCFTPGLGYVALSRVRSLQDLVIININDRAYAVDRNSKKLSTFVKKKALRGRKEFIENKADYEILLTSDLGRMIAWNPDESFANRRPKKKVPF